MTNFEHYKEEIMKITEKNKHDTIMHLNSRFNIFNRDENTGTVYDLIEWGYSEYVEPYKLTQFEKDILENLDSSTFPYIFKNGQVGDIWAERDADGRNYNITNLFPRAIFKDLEWDKDYKIADILANCEVIE